MTNVDDPARRWAGSHTGLYKAPVCFDRKAAGFSPDRVDALVWAMSDLLVEPMPNEGHFGYMRQRAAALKKPPPEPPKPVYAPGSLEYERQQAEKGE